MTERSNAQQKKVLPPVYFLAAIGVMVALHFFFSDFRWLPAPARLIGFVPIGVGLAFGVIADAQFKRHGTTVKPFQPSSALMTGGMFAVSRNPMYFGMVMILSGLGICLGTVAPLVIIPLFVWIISTRFIRVEEKMLEEQFGDTFVDYRSRVRRWI
jgi:protein-S-isoprenylcysteine O-methyltransferase Ste14